MDQYINLWIILTALIILVFAFDDFFIDFMLIVKKLKPQSISNHELQKNKEKPLAILIANWKESDVLLDMVECNFSEPDNYHVFLGVYPNDHETKKIAYRVSKNKDHVHVVENSLNGPTYKGQMLNVILESIFKFEKQSNVNFEGFVLHDSEDILSEKQINLYRAKLHENDFIQVPVLSLPRNASCLVGGTYIDEFVEMHTRELLVRQHLGAAIPSAGVGTCISRALIFRFLEEQSGEVFLPNALTEDYNLGLFAKIWGYKSIFLCSHLEGESFKNLIATREYFPDTFFASVKQKTRWSIGIAFQGYSKFGWFGNFWERYFLWRDRKLLLSTFINLNAFLILIYVSLFKTAPLPDYTVYLMLLNLTAFISRVIFRAYYVSKYFSKSEGFLSLLRWPVCIGINTLAGFRAFFQTTLSFYTGSSIKWSKTQHKIPKLLKNRAS